MRGILCLVTALLVFCLSVQESHAQLFGRNRSQVQVNVGGGQAVQVNALNRGFRQPQAQVNVFNSGRHVPFIPNTVRVNSFNSGFRVNSFGSRTAIDSFGNVFEVNAFGAPVIRSSTFRGFAVSPFGSPGCF